MGRSRQCLAFSRNPCVVARQNSFDDACGLSLRAVCPTEVQAFSDNVEAFKAVGANVVAISVDTVHSVSRDGICGALDVPQSAPESRLISTTRRSSSLIHPLQHLAWIQTSRNKGGLGKMNIPVIADVTKSISKAYGVLVEDPSDDMAG